MLSGLSWSAALTHLVLLLAAGVILAPLYWLLATALKAPDEVYLLPPVWLPARPHWENFARAWQAAPFARYLANSLVVATTVVLLELTTGALAAYAFARLRFPGRDLLFLAFLAVLMLPRQVVLVPTYLVLTWLGWLDTYQALIIPFATSALGTFLIRQSFLTIPQDLVDAARMDGAGHLDILSRILVPLTIPTFATFALLSFTWRWNDYFWPLIFTTSADMRTLPVGLVLLRASEVGVEWHTLMAGAVIVLAPIVVLFLAVQRTFIEGVARTGIRG